MMTGASEMSDRDELVVLFESVDPVSSPASYDDFATAVIDAGYRKHRVIETAEELAELPVGTIIRAGEARFKNRVIGRIFERSFGRDSWLELDPGDRNDGEETWQGEWLIKLFTAGITVLWNPEVGTGADG
jgi:hypothetical protein